MNLPLFIFWVSFIAEDYFITRAVVKI